MPENKQYIEIFMAPKCPQGVQENIISLQQTVNKKRESRGYQANVEIRRILS